MFKARVPSLCLPPWGPPHPHLPPNAFASWAGAGQGGHKERQQRPWTLSAQVPVPSPCPILEGLGTPIHLQPDPPSCPGPVLQGESRDATWRPLQELRCAHLPVLHAHRQHDDGVDLLLPHQPPEVLQGLLEGPLGDNEILPVGVAL